IGVVLVSCQLPSWMQKRYHKEIAVFESVLELSLRSLLSAVAVSPSSECQFGNNRSGRSRIRSEKPGSYGKMSSRGARRADFLMRLSEISGVVGIAVQRD